MGRPPTRLEAASVPSKAFEGFVARPEGGLNLINAWSLAKASSLAYKDEDVVIKTLKTDWGFKDVQTFGYRGGGPDTQVYVAHSAEYIVVAFRGTEPSSWRDWVSDLKFLKSRYGPFGSRVHSGFHDGLTGMVDGKSIMSLVEDSLAGRGNKAVYVTGHSLGAALGTLATAYLVDPKNKKKVEVEGLYTFGSPRVGTHYFADKLTKYIKGKAYRFVNKEDIVPRVPKIGFHHVGQWWYMGGKDQELTRRPGMWRLFRDRICCDWDWFPDSIADHSMESGYVHGLFGNLERLVTGKKKEKEPVAEPAAAS